MELNSRRKHKLLQQFGDEIAQDSKLFPSLEQTAYAWGITLHTLRNILQERKNR